jgi:LacI family transcriptional regulator
MKTGSQLKAVKAQPKRPLYAVVKEALRDAIDQGIFVPGEQMPSTKELSEQLHVSLVTAHRALQELVSCGVLERSQGRGTFVHERYLQRRHALAGRRVGLLFHREASLADYYHGQILEGVHRAADAFNVDLILLRFGEDVRNECNGYLLVNPFVEEVGSFMSAGKRQPMLIVGAQSGVPHIPSYDVDNIAIPKLAIAHLAQLGHRRIGYVGGAYKISNSRDRWVGFEQICHEMELDCCESCRIKGAGWRLDDKERAQLAQSLRGPNRVTAIFAAGYNFALEAYAAAAATGLRVPHDLSVVGVDDPSSAEHISPSLTTVRQPLVQLGYEAMAGLSNAMQEPPNGHIPIHSRKFAPELVIRRSSALIGASEVVLAAN